MREGNTWPTATLVVLVVILTLGECTGQRTPSRLPQVTDLKVLQLTTVNSTHFNQSIQWNAVTSGNQTISRYIIKYGVSSVVKNYNSTSAHSTTSPMLSTTLTLPLPRSPTTYNVWVAAVGGESVIGEYSEVLKINYTAPTRPMNLNVLGITCNQLNLTWRAPRNNGGLPIIYYKIKYRKDPGGEITTVKSTVDIITLDNLLPETTYEIEVAANNSIISDTNTKIIKTTSKRTQSASNEVTIDITSSRTVSISRIKNKNYICWVNGTSYTLNTSSIEVTGLTPDTVYSIGCVEVDEDGHYQCTEYHTTVVTAPGKVEKLDEDGLGRVVGDQIHQSISWRRPSDHTSQLHYIVKYGPSRVVDKPTHPSVNTTTSSNLAVILTLPIPTTPVVYTVWVAAVSNVGQGGYKKTKFTYEKPSPPENITVINKTCNSLSVQWSPPSDTGGLAITGYMVDVDKNSFSTKTTMTRTDITNLSPNTTYQVKVETITVFKSELKSTDFTTQSHSPPLAATSRSARVVSILPVANRASKSVHRCTLTAHYTFNTSESGGLYRVAFYTTSLGLNISSLLPDTAYSLVCTTLLPVHGCTSRFTQFTFKTLPWVTSQVKVGNSFLQNNHLQQSISWRRPPHHTSHLNYIVKYGPSNVADRPTHPSVNTTSSSNTTVILTLPIPTTPVVYNVWVAAVSDAGQGEYSQRKQVHYTTPMTAPTPIILVNRTCNAITLKWGAPPSTGGLPVLKYTLKISNNLQHSYINITSPSATLDQMEPNTKYTLAVRAVNFIGHSEWTESVMVTTLKRDGQSIQILKVTHNEIQVSIDRRWNKHDYNCTINNTDKIIALSVSDGVTFAIPNLSPNTTYDIDCIGAEDQCLEVNTTITTTATVPSELTNAIVSRTTHNSAQLKWSAPLQTGGSEIIGYKITFTSPKHSGYYIIGVTNTWELVGLVPDSKYNIEISAINSVGIGAPANITVKTAAPVERGRDTVNVTVSGQGTKVQCGLRDSGQGHSTNTSILLPGYSSVFPLLSRGTDHTLYCTNKGTQCTGFELTVTVPSCP